MQDRTVKSATIDMKNIPPEIFLQINLEGEKIEDFKQLGEVSWCSDKIYEDDIPYVLKSSYTELQTENNNLTEKVESLKTKINYLEKGSENNF